MRNISSVLAVYSSLLFPVLGFGADPTSYEIPDAQMKALEKAMPQQAPAKAKSPRKVLVYGRVPNHPECVRFTAASLQIIGKKTGAFEVVVSTDPALFAAESLKQFDAVVMNNTHEQRPMLPANYKQLDAEQQKQADAREETYKKSLLDFVESGKGIIGLHAATAGVKWPEYEKMMGGTYGGHFGGPWSVKADDPKHPLCAAIGAETISVSDEIYMFKSPFSRQNVKVLLSLDVSKKDPEKRPDKDYPISWIRQHGKGRVFYCSVPAHSLGSYQNVKLMEHVLAGIQWAIGDLEISPVLQK